MKNKTYLGVVPWIGLLIALLITIAVMMENTDQIIMKRIQP